MLDNNIQLDTEWYLDHQLAEPIKRLYEPVPRLLAEIISRDRAEIEPR